MNQKELSELRRRFRPEKSAVSHIYGCYVNAEREIISYLEEPLGSVTQEESEQYLGLLKKALSGTLGKNQIDIVFSTQQVVDSDEHRLLTALRSSELRDHESRETFYQTVIQALDMDGSNYLILLAHDAYDVPRRRADGGDDESENVFSYIVCAICPVRDKNLELGFFPGENEFHSYVARQIVAPPELGFLFPAFDGRSANLYNALFYARKPDELHHEFIDAVFHTEAPMTAGEQREAFYSALTGAFPDGCGVEIAQSVYERLKESVDAHKESKDPEALVMTAGEIGRYLSDCGAGEEQVSAFQEQCGELFGQNAVLQPANLIDSARFEVKTECAAIQLKPELSYLLETRVIDGRKYLLIPADEEIEINGLPVRVLQSGEET